MKKIAKLLKADFGESSDLASIAAMLASKGRGKDTILAHITPKEAQILKDLGGSGTTNPDTGLLEFAPDDGSYVADFGYGQAGDVSTTQFVDPSYPQIKQENYQPYEWQPNVPAQTAETTPSADLSTGGGIRTTAKYDPVQNYINQEAGATTAVPYSTGVSPYSLSGTSDYGITPPALTTTGAGLAAQGVRAGEAPPSPEKSLFGDLRTQDMIRLGLAGGLGLYGSQQAKKGAQQAQQAAEEQKAVGAPYQAKGQELIRAAESGELTPTGQQSLQALQARLAQGAESRGGVGAAQVAAQAEAYRQQLLSQQYNLGLQVSNIGDQIALGAIKTGLQADQALNQASTNFYTNLAAIGAGIPIRETRTA